MRLVSRTEGFSPPTFKHRISGDLNLARVEYDQVREVRMEVVCKRSGNNNWPWDLSGIGRGIRTQGQRTVN